MAKDLLQSLVGKFEWEDYQIVQEIQGKELDRMVAQHPFYDRDILVMNGEHVTTDTGTGLVHTAPGHGEDDYQIGKAYGLEILSPLNDQGCFTEEAPGFEGMFYEEGNKLAISIVKEKGALLKLEYFTHSYPHDWLSLIHI